MSGTSQTAPAARRLRVRLFAAVLVLAGLLALSGSQCADAMGDMYSGHMTSSAMMLDAEQGGGHSDGSGDRGGVLALCLALLFVILAVAGLRPLRLRPVAVWRRCWRAAVIRAVPTRPPSLAQLCVLRA